MRPRRKPPHRDCTCLVSNQTNSCLRLHGPDGNLLVLSPLERNKEVSPELSHQLELGKQQQRGLILLEHKQLWWMTQSASFSTFMGWTRLKLSQLPLLLVGIGVPLLVMLTTTGGLNHLRTVFLAPVDALFPRDLGAGADLAMGARQLDGSLSFLTTRILQVLLIALLSLFPFQLFYSFDREHQETLRHRFITQILRFDPAVNTKQDVMARYGKQLDEAYGPERHNGSTRLKPTRLSPLFIASVVLSLGWTITLLNLLGEPTPRQSASSVAFFQPQPHPFTFGFLGAYFYALHTLFRSYARRDLQPKTYSNITTRVLGVMVLAWVLQECWKMLPTQPPVGGAPLLPSDKKDTPESALNVIAFVAGITPETALLFIVERLRGVLQSVKRHLPGAALVDPHEQLTTLQGIDLYDRARLQDEGVTNVEGLAHHDLVELMLQTRIPAARLLGWVDQAILHLHANVPEEDDGSTEATRKDAKAFTLLERLRRYGIRKATDFEQAYDTFIEGKQAGYVANNAFHKRLRHSSQLQVLRSVIQDEEWMTNLRYWHDATGDSRPQNWCPSGRCRPDGTPLRKPASQGDGATGPETAAPQTRQGEVEGVRAAFQRAINSHA